VDLATAGAANFTLFTLFASTGFFLVVVVALFCGDTIASEASWRSLRYLLTIPVDRGHLLWRKLLVALSYCGFALVMLPVLALLVGGVFFGWAPARTPLGTSLDAGTFLWRLVICVVYIAVSLLSVAALAFLLGVWTDAPLGAVGGAVLVVIVSNILDSITSLGSWRVILPTHYAYAWLDALSPALAWGEMLRGGLWSLTYALALTIAAWWHFLRKDIVS
jgi:ABC-2 type transport system permease protein